METTNFENRLITPELTEAMSSYPLYSQDAKKKDAMCIAVFYLGNIRWYIMEVIANIYSITPIAIFLAKFDLTFLAFAS